jgi:hypothetical protein
MSPGGVTVAKLLVYLDDERHEDLKELAHRKKTTMAALLRFALEEIFEDDLDSVRGERRLEEHLADSSGSISLDDYLKERGIALQGSARKGSATRPEAGAG